MQPVGDLMLAIHSGGVIEIVTNHINYDYLVVLEETALIVNTHNILSKDNKDVVYE